MYLIQAYNNNEVVTLLNQKTGDEDLAKAELNIGYNKAGSLTIYMPYNHAAFNKIQGLSTLVKVYQYMQEGLKWLFTGRVITRDEDIYKTGVFTAEGVLSYLCDTIVRAYEYQGTPSDYVTQLIQQHNAQVDSDKQFTLGKLGLIDVDSNNNIVRANSNYPNTSTEFKDKVLDALNVYAEVEETDGKYILNVMHNITATNSQTIEFGKNIIDLSQNLKMQDIKTVIVPLGAKDEDGNRLTITAINNGKDYIYNAEAVARYGIIVGTIEFDDVTLAENLLSKANVYLQECVKPICRVEVRAVDLSISQKEIENLTLGWVHVQSTEHDINTDMILTDMKLDLLEPDNNIYTLGSTQKASSDLNAVRKRELNKEIQTLRTLTSKKIQAAVDNATELITGAQGGYVLLDGDNNGHPERILIMDSPDKTLAMHVIQINKNGIGFSTTGIDGPYANAWTIDGNLVADFITAGTMFADRIRGGTLEIGGEKDGVITVIDTDRNTLAVIDKKGITIYKGSIRGSTIIVGGSSNADGKITVLDGNGNVRITIDVNGINVNDKFSVDMEGKMTAISIDGAAVEQISDIIDQSEAMKKAKQAIKTAQGAAEKAQDAAGTAQDAAGTAQSAAETAQTAADQANSAIEKTNKIVTNLNNTIIPQINGWINQMSAQLKNLGQAGIS